MSGEPGIGPASAFIVLGELKCVVVPLLPAKPNNLAEVLGLLLPPERIRPTSRRRSPFQAFQAKSCGKTEQTAPSRKPCCCISHIACGPDQQLQCRSSGRPPDGPEFVYPGHHRAPTTPTKWAGATARSAAMGDSRESSRVQNSGPKRRPLRLRLDGGPANRTCTPCTLTLSFFKWAAALPRLLLATRTSFARLLRSSFAISSGPSRP